MKKITTPRILVGLNVLILFVGASMLIASMMFNRVTGGPSKAPEVIERFSQGMQESVGQTYTQEMHDQITGVFDNTLAAVQRGKDYNKTCAVMLRNYAICFIAISLTSLFMTARAREKAGK